MSEIHVMSVAMPSAEQVQAAGELLVRSVGGRGGERPGEALVEGGDVLGGDRRRGWLALLLEHIAASAYGRRPRAP